MRQNVLKTAADRLRNNKDRLETVAALAAAAVALAAPNAAQASTANTARQKDSRSAAERALGHRSLRAIQQEVAEKLTNQTPLQYWAGRVEVTHTKKPVTGGSKYQAFPTGGTEYGGPHGQPASRTSIYLTNPLVVSLRDPRSTKSHNEVMDLAFAIWENNPKTGKPEVTLYPLADKNLSFRMITELGDKEPGSKPMPFDLNNFGQASFGFGPNGLMTHTLQGSTGPDGQPIEAGKGSRVHAAPVAHATPATA